MIKDSFKPHGFVRIKDNNGNILFEGNNMIVKTGKDFIFSSLINNLVDTGSISNNLEIPDNSGKKLFGMFLSSNSAKTSSNMTISNCLVSDDTFQTTIEGAEITKLRLFYEFDTNNTTLDYTEDDGFFLTIKAENILIDDFRKSDDSITEVYISSLGLVYGTGNNISTMELFSRINFDPLYLSTNSSFSIQYYIYL